MGVADTKQTARTCRTCVGKLRVTGRWVNSAYKRSVKKKFQNAFVGIFRFDVNTLLFILL